MSFKYIDRIGIELEGAWNRVIPVITDNSIKIRREAYTTVGEIPSIPFSDINEINKFIDTNVPDYVDHTCGLHIHTSFKQSSHYLILMEPKFYEFFKSEMRVFGQKMKFPEKHEFWKRLRGDNRFCVAKHQPEKQVIHTKKPHYNETARTDCYTHLNYCWGIFKTIECRMFPALTSPSEIKACVNALIECYEKYLERNSKTLLEEIEVNITEEELIRQS